MTDSADVAESILIRATALTDKLEQTNRPSYNFEVEVESGQPCWVRSWSRPAARICGTERQSSWFVLMGQSARTEGASWVNHVYL